MSYFDLIYACPCCGRAICICDYDIPDSDNEEEISESYEDGGDEE